MKGYLFLILLISFFYSSSSRGDIVTHCTQSCTAIVQVPCHQVCNERYVNENRACQQESFTMDCLETLENNYLQCQEACIGTREVCIESCIQTTTE